MSKEYTPKILKERLKFVIETNKYNQDARSVTPIAVEIEGPAGLGKTSVVEQVKEELNLDCFETLNLATLEDIGDLTGFPLKQFQMKRPFNKAEIAKNAARLNKSKAKWVDDQMVDIHIAQGWLPTGQNRTSYAAPAWLSGNESKSGILLIDDYTRASPRFMQAVMQLVETQRFNTLQLPKNWHIVLTSNPDTGEYSVTSLDAAQKSRSMKFDLIFSKEDWAEWAEDAQLDSRIINFILKNPEILENSTATKNPRMAVKFANSITTLRNLQDTNQLALATEFCESNLGMEAAGIFTMFINNKLDQMMSPEDIIDEPLFIKVLANLKSMIGDLSKGEKYRADIAGIYIIRLTNYLTKRASEGSIGKKVTDRIADLAKNDVFQEDIIFQMCKTLIASSTKFHMLIQDPALAKKLI